MSLSLEVAGRDVIAADEALDRTIRSTTANDGAQGVLDFTLLNPEVIPQNGDGVVLNDGSDTLYEGAVRSVTFRQFQRTVYIDVSCQDDNEGGDLPGAAPFGLSDTPNGSTTYGFQSMTLQRQSTSGEEQTKGTAVVLQPGLLPGMNLLVTNGPYSLTAEEFNIEQVSIEWPIHSSPVYTIHFGDPLVRLVQVVTEVPDGSITETKISDGAVSTPKLAANAVTAEKIAAEIVLASLIKTAEEGQRIELDSTGLRSYDESENILVNMPTDDPDAAVYVNGQIEATALVVTGDAVLQGTNNELAAGAEMTLGGFQGPPVQPPTLAQGYESGPVLEAATSGNMGHGYYDAAGGASGATACYVECRMVHEGGGVLRPTFIEWNWTTGVVDRETPATFTVSGGPFYTSVTRIGSFWYCTRRDSSDGSVRLEKYNRSTGARTFLRTITGDFFAFSTIVPISTDATDVFVVAGAGSNLIRAVQYDISGTLLSTINLVEPTYSGDSLGFPLNYVISNNTGSTRHHIGLQHTNAGVETAHNVYDFHLTTGALGSDTEFPYLQLNGANYGAYSLVYDGTNFWGRTGTTGAFQKFTNWSWTTASAKYWVAYTWYDSAGTTHETTLGSKTASITMRKRSQMTVTTQALPGAGGADDPNSRRIYMFPNATLPADASYALQATITGASTTLTDRNAGGAAPPGANGFSTVATPAIIQTSGTDRGIWQFEGDGGWYLEGNEADFWIAGDTGTASFGSTGTVRLPNTTDVALASTGHAFQIGPSAGANISMDPNEIMARNNGVKSTLNLNADGGDVAIGGVYTLADTGRLTGAAVTLTSASVTTVDLTGGGVIQMTEGSAPAAPAANGARIYCVDAAGKTQIRARFATGVTVLIAAEP